MSHTETKSLKVEKPTKYLAIDPSIACTGVSLFENEKLIDTWVIKPKLKGRDRLNEIAYHFRGILALTNPDVLIIETQYIMPRQIKGSMVVMEVRGVIEGLYLYRNLEGIIIEVNPAEAKSCVGVKGGLKREESKKLVRQAITELFNRDFKSQDIIDSIAIGITGVRKHRSNMLLNNISNAINNGT